MWAPSALERLTCDKRNAISHLFPCIIAPHRTISDEFIISSAKSVDMLTDDSSTPHGRRANGTLFTQFTQHTIWAHSKCFPVSWAICTNARKCANVFGGFAKSSIDRNLINLSQPHAVHEVHEFCITLWGRRRRHSLFSTHITISLSAYCFGLCALPRWHDVVLRSAIQMQAKQ